MHAKCVRADLSAEISIDTLIGESNAGSLVWPKGAQYMPFLAAHGPIGPVEEARPLPCDALCSLGAASACATLLSANAIT